MKQKFFNGALLSLLCFLSSVSQAGIIQQWDLNMSELKTDFIGSAKQNDQNSKMGAGLTPNGSKAWLHEDSWFYLNLADAIGLPSLSLDALASDLILSFDFLVKNGSPEIAGIQVSDKTKQHQARAFNLVGTQSWGIRDIEYDVAQAGWQHFDINLSQYTSGSFSKIMFINDCDANNGCGGTKALFRNMSLAQVSNVAEPASLAFLAVALFGLAAIRSRKTR